jgi:ribose transport system ATP-binding protein
MAVVPEVPTGTALLELQRVGKSFGAVRALAGVDFDVRAGEVHLLVGENGAGQSTLMNILSGVLNAYDGRLLLAGRPVTFASPHAAQRAGIATVFQELDLVPTLSVSENLFLGHEPCRWGGFVARERMRVRAQGLLERVGGRISPRSLVGDLRLGERQLVTIARALSYDVRVLILDEPTAALSEHEVEALFAVMRTLRDAGVGLVFISHRLEEIARIGDRVTVMRDGRIVAEVPADTPVPELTQLLTGRSVGEMFPSRTGLVGEIALRLEGFGRRPRRVTPSRQEPTSVDLTVRRGEIVGLAGLLGAGRTELLEAVFGAAPAGRSSGRVTVHGRATPTGAIRAAQRSGIEFVPDDRRGGGLVASRSVGQNLTLSVAGPLVRAGVVRRSRRREEVGRAIREFGIKAASADVGIDTLSGGNQQKVLIGRALLKDPKVLLLDEPTRGIDVGAKADIYRLIRTLANRGLAVVVASSEITELTCWCDRVLVMSRGRVVAEVGADADAAQVLALAAG